MNYNMVVMSGWLVADPRHIVGKYGVPLCRFKIASNDIWTDKRTGEKHCEACFLWCNMFGSQIDTFLTHMRCGSPVLVQGRLQLFKWTDDKGNRYERHELSVKLYVPLPGRRTEEYSEYKAPQPEGG